MNNTALIIGVASGVGLELAKVNARKGGGIVLVPWTESVPESNRAGNAVSFTKVGYAGMQKGELVTFDESTLKFMLNGSTQFFSRKTFQKLSQRMMEGTVFEVVDAC